MNTLKNVVKKAIAVGSGAVMLGATIGAAAALDLNEYPAPFVNNGQFDGLIVVGEKAASSDIIGAIDIAASLQAASVTPTGTGGSSKTVLSGDVQQIGDSGDQLEIGEQIGAVTETLTDDDLEMLRGDTITTSAGNTDFTQTIDLSQTAAGSGLVKLDRPTNGAHDDEVGMYLYYAGGAELFTYELEFTSGLESDVDTGVAEDLEDESIFLLGSYYSIVSADVADAAGSDDVTLELIAGEVTDTLSQGETKTYTIDGTEYEVTVLAIGTSNDESTVKFLVNGEVTDTMQDGDTEELNDGLEIGVRDIIEVTAYRESDPSSIVEFYLGANKVVLEDLDTDTAGTGTVEINEENIEDARLDIVATVTATDLTINSLTYSLDADAAEGTNVWVGAGERVSDLLDEPEGMLNPSWDIAFEGMSEPDSSDIRFVATGDEAYDFEFTNRRGDDISVPYYHAQTSGSSTDGTFGDENDNFVFWEINTNAGAGADVAGDYLLRLDDYFVLTDMGVAAQADNNDDSYVLQWNDVNEDDKTLTFDVLGGDEIETTAWTGDITTATAGAPVTGSIKVGGKDFDFFLYDTGSNVYALAVDLDNSGTYGGIQGVIDVVDVVTQGGGIVRLAANTTITSASYGPTTANWAGNLTTLAEDVDSNVAQAVTFGFTETGDEVDLDTLPAAADSGTWYRATDTDADVQYGVTGYGAWFEKTDESDESDSLTITYPNEQVEAQVYVIGGDVQTSISSIAGGSGRINPISIGSAVLDKDVNVDQDNMIVVGGPCANSIAAELLDSANSANCAEGFTEGHAMIRLFDTGKYTALLVAGYDAADTVAASRVVAEYARNDLSGMEADVVTTGKSVQVMNK
jgi:hypothetical protein